VNAAAALGAKVRRHRADELDRSNQVGGDHVIDLRVGKLFGRAEQAVAGVAYDRVDASEPGKRAFDHLSDRRHIGYVELST
jgi:hypothetical protein